MRAALAILIVLMAPLLSARVIISEVMYHPVDDGRCIEFIEIHNTDSDPVSLERWTLREAVDFEFPNITISGDEHLVIAGEPRLLEALTDLTHVLGPWKGSLNNSGERLALHDSAATPIDEINWSDKPPWPGEADGLGSSLERMINQVPGGRPVAWAASIVTGGTPGAPNSAAVSPTSPWIESAEITPTLPRSDEPIRVTTSVPRGGQVREVRLRWRVDGPDAHERPFESQPMMYAGGALWSTEIPPQPDGSLIEVHVELINREEQSLLFPPTAPETNLLVEVDDIGRTEYHDLPVLRVLATDRDWSALHARNIWDNTLINCTVIHGRGDQVWQNVGIRLRGKSSRTFDEKSYRIEFAGEPFLRDTRELNLNAGFTELQVLMGDLFRRAGLPGIEIQMVGVILRGEPMRDFAWVESYDDTFLRRRYGDRADESELLRGEERANLDFRGFDPDQYRAHWDHQAGSDSDLERLIDLCATFSLTDDVEFPTEIAKRIDVDQWLRFLAINVLAVNREGGISNHKGDDFFIHLNPLTGLFEILPWDLDACFVDPTEDIFAPSVPAIARLIQHPEFAPRYHAILREYREGIFSIQSMTQRLRSADLNADYGDPQYLDHIPWFLSHRHEGLRAQSPERLRVALARTGRRLIDTGDDWHIFAGITDPGSDWTSDEFDTSDWSLHHGPFGYGLPNQGTNLISVRGRTNTLFMRTTFTLDDVNDAQSIELDIDYDDAFAVHLNGTEVLRVNVHQRHAQQARLTNRAIPAEPHLAGKRERFDLSAHRDLLRDGENTLAIQAINWSANSDAFRMDPRLLIRSQPSPRRVAIAADAEWWSLTPRTEPMMPDGVRPLPWHHPNFRFFEAGFRLARVPMGFGHAGLTTELGAMRGISNSHLLRRNFDVTDPRAITGLWLALPADDGIVVYLNGREVLRRNVEGVTGTAVHVGQTAQIPFAPPPVPDAFDLSGHLDKLAAGPNTLAIHGLSSGRSDRQLRLAPELIIEELPTEVLLDHRGDTLTLQGVASVFDTRSVWVNGERADLDVHTGRWEHTIDLHDGLNGIDLVTRSVTGEILDQDFMPVLTDADPMRVSGEITADTTWGAEDGVIHVTDDLTVAPDVTLTLRDALVALDPGVNLRVEGGLHTDGALFTSAVRGERWGMIDLAEPSERIEMHSTDIYWGTINALGADLMLFNSSIRYANSLRVWNIAHVIMAEDSALRLIGCTFESNEAPILIHRPREVIIDGCHFTNTRGDHDAIDVDAANERGGVPPETRFEITNTVIDGVGDDAIDWFGLNAVIEDITIIDVVDKGISFEHEGHSTMRNIRIHNAQSGIVAKSGATATLSDSTLNGCAVSVETRDTATVDLENVTVDGQPVTRQP